MAIISIPTEYLSEKDMVYRPCTPEEFHAAAMKSMTAFAEVVGNAAEKAAETADKE